MLQKCKEVGWELQNNKQYEWTRKLIKAFVDKYEFNNITNNPYYMMYMHFIFLADQRLGGEQIVIHKQATELSSVRHQLLQDTLIIELNKSLRQSITYETPTEFNYYTMMIEEEMKFDRAAMVVARCEGKFIWYQQQHLNMVILILLKKVPYLLYASMATERVYAIRIIGCYQHSQNKPVCITPRMAVWRFISKKKGIPILSGSGRGYGYGDASGGTKGNK